jgi:hypothetical protein|tara:strand:+ start:990 stop:1145 length:156 start_codon:yes stop_codon:yes gene_type:complete
MKKIYKATQQDINMPVDEQLQKRILKYLCWGLGMFLFWSIMFVNFLFWLFR